jgi:hypothetical protein
MCLWCSSMPPSVRTPPMTDSHLHRSHHNLKAYRSAFTLHTDVFWISRGFPVRLDFSLTRPMRNASEHIVEEILQAWRSRHDETRFAAHLGRALEEVNVLDLYLLRAREEDVLPTSDYIAFTSRLSVVSSHIKRLPRQISIST